MIEGHQKCLEVLEGRYVRALARKGFAEYFRGLCREDGDFAGAGYCITRAGVSEL